MASTNYEFAHIHNPDYYQDQAVADTIKDHLDMLGVIYADVATKRSAIEINSGLTAEGKSSARKELIIEIKQARQGWLDRLSPLDRQIADIEKEMVLTSHRPDDVVARCVRWKCAPSSEKWIRWTWRRHTKTLQKMVMIYLSIRLRIRRYHLCFTKKRILSSRSRLRDWNAGSQSKHQIWPT